MLIWTGQGSHFFHNLLKYEVFGEHVYATQHNVNELIEFLWAILLNNWSPISDKVLVGKL